MRNDLKAQIGPIVVDTTNTEVDEDTSGISFTVLQPLAFETSNEIDNSITSVQDSMLINSSLLVVNPFSNGNSENGEGSGAGFGFAPTISSSNTTLYFTSRRNTSTFSRSDVIRSLCDF